MIEITDKSILNNLELLLAKNEVVEQQSSSKAEQNTNEKKEVSEDSTRVELSQSVLKELNNYIGTEDILIKKLNTAQSIYDKLGEVQTELFNIKTVLKDTPENDNIKLSVIDELSNGLIDKVIGILKTDVYGIVDSNYLNNSLKKLNYIYNLPINDNNYIDKLNNIDTNIAKQSSAYELASKNLYENLINLYKKIDEEAKIPANKEENSEDLQNKIINDPINTVKSVTADLLPESILGLIQG